MLVHRKIATIYIRCGLSNCFCVGQVFRGNCLRTEKARKEERGKTFVNSFLGMIKPALFFSFLCGPHFQIGILSVQHEEAETSMYSLAGERSSEAAQHPDLTTNRTRTENPSEPNDNGYSLAVRGEKFETSLYSFAGERSSVVMHSPNAGLRSTNVRTEIANEPIDNDYSSAVSFISRFLFLQQKAIVRYSTLGMFQTLAMLLQMFPCSKLLHQTNTSSQVRYAIVKR